MTNSPIALKVSTEEVQYIAALARLRFDSDEEARLAEQMSSILDYVEKLDELDLAKTPPMSHVLDLYNVHRSDEMVNRITHEEALVNAPKADGDYFRVPKVID